MVSLRNLFPSFEKPVDRPRYLNLEPARRDFRGRAIGIVLVLAASCGVGLALWEPSTQVTTPFASVSRPAPAGRVASTAPAAGKTSAQETTAKAAAAEPAVADADDDLPAPTVKLSTFCSQRTTARRDCANAKAFKEARIKAAEPAEPAKTEPAPSAIQVSKAVQPEPIAAPEKVTEAAAQPEPAPPVQRKVKRPKTEEAPVERLVRVYDQIMPDGRRVPVYRRANGSLEIGTVVDGEYRQARRAESQYGARYFGLQ